MSDFHRPAWAEIDTRALASNFAGIKKLAGDRTIIAVVKADAYGHGAVRAARIFLAGGASMLAVAVPEEAAELREAGIGCPIVLLGYAPPALLGGLLGKYDMEPTIFTYEDAKELSALAARLHRTIRLHVAVETGMGRIGFGAKEDDADVSAGEILKISRLPGIEIHGLFSHFSTADEDDKTWSHTQYARFRSLCAKLGALGVQIPLRHITNSAALIDLPETYCDAVRPGIILYGYYPSDAVQKARLPLTPALTLKANVVHLKTIQPGDPVSYGRKFVAGRPTVIATLPIGYADGWNRRLSNRGHVLVGGRAAPIVGNICMDQCMIDVTDAGPVKVGDEAVLIGRSGSLAVTADDVANELGTISYEVLSVLSRRLPRIYL